MLRNTLCSPCRLAIVLHLILLSNRKKSKERAPSAKIFAEGALSLLFFRFDSRIRCNTIASLHGEQSVLRNIVYSGRSSALNPYVIRAVFRPGGVQLHNFSIYFKGVHKYERHYSRRRCRHTALPADHGQRVKPCAGTAGENNAFHICALL